MGAGRHFSADLAAAEQVILYRSVAYTVGAEREGVRQWVIFPADGPVGGALHGTAVQSGKVGSFKSAVRAAEMAIDGWLAAHGEPKTDP